MSGDDLNDPLAEMPAATRNAVIAALRRGQSIAEIAATQGVPLWRVHGIEVSLRPVRPARKRAPGLGLRGRR